MVSAKLPRTTRIKDPAFVKIKLEIAKYPITVRNFALKTLVVELRGDITKALKNRRKYVPQLAETHSVTEKMMRQALDVLWLIRQI